MTNKLERELRRLSRLVADQQEISAIVVRRAEEILSSFRWEPPKIPRKDRSKKHEEVCVLHLSDTQIGKRTTSFNSVVAAQRVERYTKKIRKIVDNRRTGAKIEECVVFLGGDIVEGETIFPHQPWCVDDDLWGQAIRTAPKILSSFITSMAGMFRKVRVYSVPGNHGRSQPKNSGASPRTNFDMIATQITRLIVSKELSDNRVEWDIDHDTFYRIAPVLGQNLLLIHGDQISGGGGIGGYPLTGLARKIAGWAGSIPDEWSAIFLGHFHRPMSGVIQDKMFYANGTLESDNDFALEVIGEAGRPCQRVVFFDKEHGPISDSLIWLD
jgi:hypothetical protein